MKLLLILVSIIIFSIIGLVIVYVEFIPQTNSLVITTDQEKYKINESVEIMILNDSNEIFRVPLGLPVSIRNSTGDDMKICSGSYPAVVTMEPHSTSKQIWDIDGCSMVQVLPGMYEISINYNPDNSIDGVWITAKKSFQIIP